MPRTNSHRHEPAALLALLLASVMLTACGGSTKAPSSSSATTAGSATGLAGIPGRGFTRIKALRECLQKNGITLPKRSLRSPGTPREPGAGGFLGGGQLPKGVTRAQFDAAVKKCGGGNFARAGKGPLTSGAVQRLSKFDACMRENGVNLPASNGASVNTKGVNTASAKYKAAEAKCVGELVGGIHVGGIHVGGVHVGPIHVGPIHVGGLGANGLRAPGPVPPAGKP